VREIDDLAREEGPAIASDLAKNTSPEQWAKEGLELAKKQVYLDGKLRALNSDKHPPDVELPTAPESYAKAAGHTARVCVAKAGKRLATVLSEAIGDR
jgi:hypothetical protein